MSEAKSDNANSGNEDYEFSQEGGVDCPFCSGTGLTGNGMFEESCPLCRGSGIATEEEIEEFDEDAPFFGRTPDDDMILADLEQGGDQVRARGDGIDGLDFSGASMWDYSLAGLSLQNCTFDRASFGTLVKDCSFESCSFIGANFSRTVLKNVTFSDGTFASANFEDANLSGATFDGVIDVTGSSLEEVAQFGEHYLDDFLGLLRSQVVQLVSFGARFRGPDRYPPELAERAVARRAEKLKQDDQQRRYQEGYGRWRKQLQEARDRLGDQQDENL